jgi:hypothetical protein
MAYLGNSPVLSQQEYRNIDNISGSFNGVTTSFPLLVNGVAPVPAPQSSNQCLISVNGVVQKPDDTGASGFRLSGGNIVFSAAPTGGQSFFGVILAGADYIYAGSNFPDGTVSAPSITFAQDLDTGFYRSGAGEVKFTANGANVVTLSANNLTAPSFIPTGSSAPSNGVYLPSANNVAISTNGTKRLAIDSGGNISIDAVTDTGSKPLSIYSAARDAEIRLTTNSGTENNAYLTLRQSGGNLDLYSTNGAIVFNPANTERMRLDASGRLGLGTSSPSTRFHAAASISTLPSPEDYTTTVGYFNNTYLNTTNGTSSYTVLRLRREGEGGVSYASTADFGIARYEASGTNSRTRLDIKLGHAGTNTTDTTVMSLLSSGAVGIGTTSPGNPLAISQTVSTTFGNAGTYLGLGGTENTAGQTVLIGLGYKGAATNEYPAVIGYTATSNAGNQNGAIVFGTRSVTTNTAPTERARIDSDGRLLVGTSTAYGNNYLQIQGDVGASAGTGAISLRRGVAPSGMGSGSAMGIIDFGPNDGGVGARIEGVADAQQGTNDYPGRLVFSTTADGASSPTERMRITNGGVTKLTSTGSYYGASSAYHESRIATANHVVHLFNHNASSGSIYGIQITYDQQSKGSSTSDEYIYCNDSGAVRMSVRGNGGIANYSGNNVNLCDEREKKNIVNLDSTWDCLKHWELKKFHYNEDADADDLRYGVIAQQVADYCPEVISEWVKQKAEPSKLDDEGNEIEPAKEEVVRMAVKEQQMMWMAIKALQEAQLRIETLEAEVAALKGA